MNLKVPADLCLNKTVTKIDFTSQLAGLGSRHRLFKFAASAYGVGKDGQKSKDSLSCADGHSPRSFG